jgi:hypothetical protein
LVPATSTCRAGPDAGIGDDAHRDRVALGVDRRLGFYLDVRIAAILKPFRDLVLDAANFDLTATVVDPVLQIGFELAPFRMQLGRQRRS